jgi:hypothetical protein
MAKNWRKKEIQDAIRIYAGRRSMKEIASLCNAATGTICNYAHQMGISLVLLEKKKSREQILEFIINNHSEYTAREVSLRFSMPIGTVYRYAWDMGLSFKPDYENGSSRSKFYQKMQTKGIFNEHKHSNWLI